MKAVDYEVVKVIGRGAFGEVQLVRIPLCVSCVANNTKYSFLKSCCDISNIFFNLPPPNLFCR